jgi:hypothetical protein
MAKMRTREDPGGAFPGPGTYQIGEAEKAKPNYMGKIEWKFGTAPRSEEQKNAAIPGPGMYQLKSFIGPGHGASYSMTPRRGLGNAKEFL